MNFKKETRECKFDRKYWVHNTAKRNFFRYIKRYNNKVFRKKYKLQLKEYKEKENEDEI